jgi:hypothetical protein
MADALSTYLHDHLSGSVFALELLDSVEKEYKDDELGAFAGSLKAEIKPDQEVLEQIIEHVGKAGLDLKQAAGWIAEKASRLKLRGDDTQRGIGTFEALETLALGIQGKLALWKVLRKIRNVDTRVPPLDFAHLIARAEDQYRRVEERRLATALVTFKPAEQK